MDDPRRVPWTIYGVPVCDPPKTRPQQIVEQGARRKGASRLSASGKAASNGISMEVRLLKLGAAPSDDHMTHDLVLQ